VKFVQIDFFNPKEYPPLQLPFEVPENYIPTASSMMKNLEDSVVHAVDKFPELADRLLLVISRVGDLLGEIENRRLPEKAGNTMANMDLLLEELRRSVAGMETGKLSKSAQEVLGRMGGERGMVASAKRTSDSMGNVSQNSSHVGPALEETLRDVQSAAQAIQRLAESLDRDPDMLLKGRAKRVTQ
jgi:hypothetical protein